MIDKDFFLGRDIPQVPKASRVYVDWFKEQVNRCMNGYEKNGLKLTGQYYFFLNFWKINRLSSDGVEVLDYPTFNYVDKEVFDYLELARALGKNFLMITGRGMGKSYIASSIIGHSYTFYKNTYNIVSASIDFHARKLFMKIKEGLDEIHTDFYHNRIKNDDEMIISGIKYKDEFGNEKIKGYRSVIEKIVFGNEAGKVRGGRPKWVIMEEIGSWTGKASLKDCYSAMEASLVRGAIKTGTAILNGTGGERDSGGSIDARDMFYNPDAFNLLSFNYEDKKTCYFVPAWKKLEGFYNEEGINNDKEAKEFLEKRREQKKDANDFERYEKEIQEFPFYPEEAFKISSISPFSILRLRLEELLLGKQYVNLIKRGDLVMTGKKLFDGYPEVKFIANPKGVFQILEFPYWYNDSNSIEGYYVHKEIKEEDVIENLYLSGCDSYDQDKSFHSESKGSLMVFKRTLNVDSSNNLFVAQYTDRPEKVEDFYFNTLLLNLFYRCKMLVEHTKIGIISWYKLKKFEYLLWEAPKLTRADIRYSKTSNRYGYLMSERHKLFAIEKYVEYIRENTDKFYFIDQIQDHIEFNLTSNRFDRTIASMLCIIQDNELYDVQVRRLSQKQIELPYWRYDESGSFVFK